MTVGLALHLAKRLTNIDIVREQAGVMVGGWTMSSWFENVKAETQFHFRSTCSVF
jgi:hypothetical protein